MKNVKQNTRTHGAVRSLLIDSLPCLITNKHNETKSYDQTAMAGCELFDRAVGDATHFFLNSPAVDGLPSVILNVLLRTVSCSSGENYKRFHSQSRIHRVREKKRPLAFLLQVLHFLIDFHSFCINRNRNEYSMTTCNLRTY